MRRFLTWLTSIAAWQLVRDSGVWAYYENTVTGRRKAYRVSTAHQPLDFEFLGAGDKIVDLRGVRILD